MSDELRGPVLEVAHEPSAAFAALFTESTTGIDLSAYQSGSLEIQLRHIEGPSDYRVKLDCFFETGCYSADVDLALEPGNEWQTITVPVSAFTSTGLDITRVNTGIVIWARDHDGTRFRIDSIRFTAD